MKALIIERQAVKQNIAVVKARAGSAAIYAALTGEDAPALAEGDAVVCGREV